MKRIVTIIAAFVLGLMVPGALLAQTVPTDEERIANARAFIAQADAELAAIGSTGPEPTGPPAPTGPTAPPTGPTGPEEIPPAPAVNCLTEPGVPGCAPQRAPADSASQPFFNISILNFDLPPGEGVLHEFRFETAQGFEFYDRRHYSCASLYVQPPGGGERLASVTLRTVDGIAYGGLNDRYGNEHALPADGVPSGCPMSTDPGEPPGEIEEKPVGLQDTTITFVLNGVPVSSILFPATAPRNADTWFELEESEVGPNHVVIEAYWEDDLVVVIDIHRISADVDIVVS